MSKVEKWGMGKGAIAPIIVGALVLAFVLATGPGAAHGESALRRSCPSYKDKGGSTIYKYRTKGISCRRGHRFVRKWVRSGNYCSGRWHLATGRLTCVRGKKRISFQVNSGD